MTVIVCPSLIDWHTMVMISLGMIANVVSRARRSTVSPWSQERHKTLTRLGCLAIDANVVQRQRLPDLPHNASFELRIASLRWRYIGNSRPFATHGPASVMSKSTRLSRCRGERSEYGRSAQTEQEHTCTRALVLHLYHNCHRLAPLGTSALSLTTAVHI